MSEKQNSYEDILYMSRPTSARHVPMSRENRAAQFAPFAALTGYDDAVRETARLTEAPTQLDENEKELLDRRLRLLAELTHKKLHVTVRYFKRDARKAGGSYLTYEGLVSRLDKEAQTLVLANGTEIAFSDISALEGEWLSFFEGEGEKSGVFD